MRLITTRHELAPALRAQRGARGSLGLVPTMGALHAGHRSLIERSRALDDVVAVSIFVNPSQFNDPIDFAHYPRSIEADLELAADAGADLVFAPEVNEMYSSGEADRPGRPRVLGNGLEGSNRPGHFSWCGDSGDQTLRALRCDAAPISGRRTTNSWCSCGGSPSISPSRSRSSAARRCASRRLALSSRNVRLSSEATPRRAGALPGARRRPGPARGGELGRARRRGDARHPRPRAAL